MRVVKFHIRNLARALARFARARDGNIALTFAIALIPMLAFVGAAVDFSHANAIKASMLAALDSTALMTAKSAASLSSAQVQTSAQSIFLAMFTRPEAKNVTFTASYSNSGGSSVVVSASADMDTDFLGLIGYKTITIAGTSTAKWGSSRLRVALVLDNTGSMASDGKIGALKTATKNLLTQLQNAATNNGDVYVSIIPFSKDVSVDATSNYSASWIDWTDWADEPAIIKTSKPSNWSSIGSGSSCPFSNSSHGFQCTTGPANGSSTTNTIPSNGSYAGYICPSIDSGGKNAVKLGIYYNGCYNSVPTTTTTTTTVSSGWSASCYGYSNCSCTGSGGSKVCKQTTTTTGTPYTHSWIPNATSSWNGCITDRGTSSAPSTSNYDQNVTAPTTGNTATLYPAEQYSYCALDMMGLNYNWSAMSSLVNQMTPNGSTNQPIGLVWGWQSLVGGGPLTAPTKDSNYTYTDVIILLSDGLNTQDRWYGNGSSTNTSVDARMVDSSGKGTCANIKAAGVTIYSIQVNTGGDPTSTLLTNCASSSDKFFLLTSASQIITTFNTIGTNLTKLRIAQ